MAPWSRRWLFESKEGLAHALRAIGALQIPYREGRSLELVLRPERIEKSHDQRKAFHALVEEFGNALGMTPGEAKDAVKRAYYGEEWKTLPSGHRYEVERHTEEEDMEHYGRLIDFLIQLGAENGVRLVVKPRRSKGA